MNSLEGLNEAQREAVMVTHGPLLLLAGAGSGKTKTLTHRIAHLIEEGIWPEEILAVTFTNKAAREMRERLWRLVAHSTTQSSEAIRSGSQIDSSSLETRAAYVSEDASSNVPPRGFMPWMGTFHSVCVRLLRIEGEAISIPKNFVIYDEDDRRGLIKQAMKMHHINDKQIKPTAVSSAISSAKNKLLTPSDMKENARYPFQQTVATLYATYERERKNASALDFDDLLVEVVRLLREHEEVRNRWRDKFKHILIDEYQDTNAAQYAIVKYLVGKDRNICVVGDDWQSIYSWRGADFTNILSFERDFPGAKVVKLEQNYRSTEAILEAAQNVITKNTARSDKKLWTEQKGGAPVEVEASYDETEEAFRVASRIGTQVSIGARQPRDFAVLYRTNAQSYTLERALLQSRISYQIIGGVRFYDRAEIKDIIAYLRLLYQPNDRMSFSRIVNVPTRGIGATSLEKFLLWQSESGEDIISALKNAEMITSLTPRARSALKNLGGIYAGLISLLESETPPAELVEELLRRTGYKDYLNDGTPKSEERLENVGSLVSDAAQFISLADFLEEAALMSSVDSPVGSNVVTLMTLHAAKGLEFPVVFMVGMEEGLLPHSRVFDGGNDDLEEERRLCYVGMTRAREELYLSYASSRLQFGQRSYNAPSRFLTDMGTSIAALTDETTLVREDVYVEPEVFDIGDRVRSRQFGEGEIIDVDGLAVTVRFDSKTTKKLNTEYARLTRL